MKILCLHPSGQNGQMLEAGMRSVIQHIQDTEPGVSFEFPNGPVRCASLPQDVAATHDYYDVLTDGDTRKAHEWLTGLIKQNGPFEGVIAFSQAAALVLSYLLYEQWYHGEEQNGPFRFAFFIDGSLPLSILKNIGVPVSKTAERMTEEAEERRRLGLGPLPSHSLRARQAIYNSDDCFGLNLNEIARELKIRIPTVHVWRDNDPGLVQATHLAGMCDPYIRKIHILEAHGTSRPQLTDDADGFGELLLWCLRRAKWPGQVQA
ncbi:hypothetical protein F5Y18DRAFT_439611 [Xylariaceae sp. FL1019]|nr:hypothetical protein F5Y18DRAFT_439611 [Xylariaceae sp. FL1019]